jgi:hypothetical protein
VQTEGVVSVVGIQAPKPDFHFPLDVAFNGQFNKRRDNRKVKSKPAFEMDLPSLSEIL